MESDRKIFLHMSDIHLREEEMQGGVDRDMDLRCELVRDAKKLKGIAFDCLDGVFLTGDIAFGGKTVEFTSARDWIDEIRTELGFPHGAVWCVPGNHDVNRTLIEGSRNRQKARELVRLGGEARAAQELHELLKDEISNTILLGPLRAFNESFAAGFQCTTRFPELCWSDSLPLGDRYRIVLTGLNSAVISDGNDDNDQGRLVLGLTQIQSIRRRPGDIHVSLCHHPPRWLLDCNEVEDFLNSRTTLQLFGHEHDRRIRCVNDSSVQVFAGALHPQRDEERWEPSYNLIEIGLLDDNCSTRVLIRIWPRRWDAESTEFRSATADRDSTVEFQLPIGEMLPIEHHDQDREPSIEASDPIAEGGQLPPGSATVQETERMPRDIVYLFFLLPLTARLRIALELGLYQDEDTNVDAAEMGRRVFIRAREQNKLDLLAERITQNEI